MNLKTVIKKTIFSLCLLASAVSLSARDVTERAVENMNSWQETFDLENKKGKYNVIVTAKDKGGNTTIGGPFNIFIDPNSDLPVIGITNPEPNLRVPGNLNIVGTCIDDDGVDYVELILDGAAPVRAKGKEFWSYFINTTQLEEGNHTIEAYGVDINGVKGNTVKHVWCLDRKEPLTAVNNYAMGALVSGVVQFDGVVSDGNGIAALDFSLDEGQTFESISLKKDKKGTDISFSYKLDTKKLADGPAVMWFFAHDGQGSIGFYPFLLFVDNTKPKIDIVYPAEKEVVKGAFTAAGIASDVVGLKSLKWSFNGDSGNFDIIAGNSYWVKEFNNVKNIKSGKLIITAEDTAGNISTKERNIVLDSEGDRPKVSVAWPAPGASLAEDEEFFVRGLAVDDDNVSKVRVLLDGNEIALLDSQGAFCQSLLTRGPVAKGNHKISVSAIDEYGVEGHATVVDFSAVGGKPWFNAVKVTNANIEIEALTNAGFSQVWYAQEREEGAGSPVGVKAGEKDLRRVITVPAASLGEGEVALRFHVTDTLGRSAEYLARAEIVAADKGYIVRNCTGAAVKLPEDEEGPAIEITSPEAGGWVRNSVRLTGSVSDAGGISSIEYSLDNGSQWNFIQFRSGSTSAAINSELNLEPYSEGLIPIDIRARNAAGRTSYYRIAVCKDVTPPAAQILVPEAEVVINGQNTIAILVSDNGALAKAEYGTPTTRNGRAGVQRSQIPMSSGMASVIVGNDDYDLDQTMSFYIVDAAGNETAITEFPFTVDRESDLPVVQVQIPFENQVITKDFTISGIVLDDDGPSTVAYRIDRGAFKPVGEPSYSFKIDVPISEMTDNEHTIFLYAIDINGVRGRTVQQKFRVSLAEPVAELTAPDINTTQKEIVTLRGTASDANGIKSVEVSLDNGNSYNLAEGTTNWSYTFDTRVLPDGTHVVFVRTTDNYDITSLYSTQVNIDNTKPEINLELPLDDSKTSGLLFFSGFTLDNIYLQDLTLTITSLDGYRVPESFRNRKLNVDRVITETIDLTPLESGLYNVKLTGSDAAGNITSVSRNITLDKRIAAANVDIYYPMNGERKQGAFNIVGAVRAERNIEKLELIMDGKVSAETVPNETNYYKFPIEEKQLEEGIHSYSVRATLEGGATISSMVQTVDYNPFGAWVRIDNFDYGNFAYDRPVIKGTAGYSINPAEIEASKRKGGKDLKEEIALRKVELVEISLNNGRTFTKLSKKANWKYRIEDEDLSAGYHFLLIRAKMANGEVAVTRCIVQIDKTAPFVRIIAPSIGGRYNQNLTFSGLSNDDVGLSSVTLGLRKGDKSSYGVPKFIQGLYLDTSFWGATLFDIGVGLTFFDDNVRLQFNWGQFTQKQRDIFKPDSKMRYGGNSIPGIKIIANIANLPFGWMFGHDWDWLSANIAIGASFKYFNETASGSGQILSAIIAQLEFPRMHFEKWKRFRTMAAYTEFQLWFIPSDTSSVGLTTDINRVVFQTSFGFRVNIF